MRKSVVIIIAWVSLWGGASAFAQAKYPIAYNFEFIERYEFVNAMAMSEANKEYYSVLIAAYKNQGDTRLQVNDSYEIVTSKGERHRPGLHLLVKKDVESRRKFSSDLGKIGWLDPGQTRYRIAVFDVISEGTPSFKLYIQGLPDPKDPALKYEVVADYERVKGVWRMRKSELKSE